MLLLPLLLACTDPKPTDTAKGGDSADSAADSAETADTTDTTDTVDSSGDTGDTGEPADSTTTFCADAATMTYANFGRGFLTGNCQACHASTTADRYGAPEGVSFDTVEEAWSWSDAILNRATSWDGEEPSMPPRGGVSDDDRTRLEWWLVCGTPGT